MMGIFFNRKDEALPYIVSKQTLRALKNCLPPLAIFLTGKLLFELLAFNFPGLNQNLIVIYRQNTPFPTAILFQEIKARLFWLTSVLVFFFVSGLFAAVIWKQFHRINNRFAVLLFFLLALFFSLLETTYFTLADKDHSPLVSIFRFTYDSLSAAGIYTDNQLMIVYVVLTLINSVAVLVVPFGIMASCCIMYHLQDCGNKELEEIIRQSKDIKSFLSYASAVMVVGQVHMGLWLSWPISLLSDENLIHPINNITLAISQYFAVVYTLTMAAVYLPTTYVLSERAKNLINENDSEEKRKSDERLIKSIMLPSFHSQLPQLLSVIAPVLVSAITTIYSNLNS